jgi:hypothetical protein
VPAIQPSASVPMVSVGACGALDTGDKPRYDMV